MDVTKIKIENFKRISKVEIPLSRVNYLVGGNNSGKSSVLQAIHMAASCAKLSLERKEQVLPEAELRYSPTSEFTLLGHSAPYENKATGSRGRIEFTGTANDDTVASYRVEIYKGRNYGSVGVDRSGTYSGFGQEICDPKSMFSVFVPGISGIPHREEHKNYASVFLKAAGGEANLVFRNIIRILDETKKISEVEGILNGIIGSCKICINHDAEKDLFVDVQFSQDGGKSVPIDLTGTGILQLVQIVAYVCLFEPKFLLVDEPDNHLHPSRQAILAKTFDKLSELYGSTIVVTTHSRHLVAAASSNANIVWMKDGKIESDECKDLASVLMDLGALDQLDSQGADCIICTEDKGKRALENCVESLGLSERIKVISYNGINNAASSIAIKAMADLYENNPLIIVHRDRDFMIDDEVRMWGADYINRDMVIFSPPLCDVEAYHCTPDHVAAVYDLNEVECRQIVQGEIDRSETDFRTKFRKKRQEANQKFWRDGGSPNTNELWPENEGGNLERAYGKKLISNLNERLSEQPGGRRNLEAQVSQQLMSLLRDCLEQSGFFQVEPQEAAG
ncbi:AAA family ATPase [Sulfitobacter faviae]|uniref:ATP-dependent nuclease n=1 Tax=Sulfitobacter faviae TaxID=1775881 RepID=UPI00230763A1|nr:ATP-binding protein [Sulfitobacter faviae]WCE66265.1 AAA family ATPase [Sulfitobacter faviae]